MTRSTARNARIGDCSYRTLKFLGFSRRLTIQLLFAVSPLLVLGYILLSAWEDPEAEEVKRRKKTDFELDGHAE